MNCPETRATSPPVEKLDGLARSGAVVRQSGRDGQSPAHAHGGAVAGGGDGCPVGEQADHGDAPTAVSRVGRGRTPGPVVADQDRDSSAARPGSGLEHDMTHVLTVSVLDRVGEGLVDGLQHLVAEIVAHPRGRQPLTGPGPQHPYHGGLRLLGLEEVRDGRCRTAQRRPTPAGDGRRGESQPARDLLGVQGDHPSQREESEHPTTSGPTVIQRVPVVGSSQRRRRPLIRPHLEAPPANARTPSPPRRRVGPLLVFDAPDPVSLLDETGQNESGDHCPRGTSSRVHEMGQRLTSMDAPRVVIDRFEIRDGDVAGFVLSCGGEIDSQNAHQLAAAVTDGFTRLPRAHDDTAAPRGGPLPEQQLLVDLRAVEFLGASAISALLEGTAAAGSQHPPRLVIGDARSVMLVVDVLDLRDTFQVHHDLIDALRDVPKPRTRP